MDDRKTGFEMPHRPLCLLRVSLLVRTIVWERPQNPSRSSGIRSGRRSHHREQSSSSNGQAYSCLYGEGLYSETDSRQNGISASWSSEAPMKSSELVAHCTANAAQPSHDRDRPLSVHCSTSVFPISPVQDYEFDYCCPFRHSMRCDMRFAAWSVGQRGSARLHRVTDGAELSQSSGT